MAEWEGLFWQAEALIRMKNPAEAKRWIETMIDIARRQGNDQALSASFNQLAAVACREADWTRLHIFESEAAKRLNVGIALNLVQNAIDTCWAGNERKARSLLARVDTWMREDGAPSVFNLVYTSNAFMTVAASAGKRDDMDRAAELAREADASGALNPRFRQVVKSVLATDACVRGDLAMVRELYQESDWHRADAPDGMLGSGALGRLAIALGETAKGVELLREGRKAMQGYSIPFFVWATYELGTALFQRARPGDADEGTALLQEALELSERHQMPLFAKLAKRALELAKEGTAAVSAAGFAWLRWESRPGDESAHSDGIGGMSARELQVLRILAAGNTDKEIAAKLGISVRTVNRHVESLRRKIGCGNRTEAARYAIEHGIA